MTAHPASGPLRPAMVAELGPDLHSLVADLGSPVTAVERITGLARGPDQPPQTFRLALADGRVVKGRRHGSARASGRFAALARLLDGIPLCRVLASAGEATLEEWVDGRPLDRAGEDVDPVDLARWAGDVLGRLHRTPLGRAAGQFTRRDGTEARMESLAAALRGLAAREALARDVADCLRSRARDAMPPDPLEYGFAHRDLAPENVVLGPGGPVLVDNTTLAVGALDEDLARTWYRWPMRPLDQAAFVEAYERHRGIDRFRRHFDFWMILALAEAARYRLQVAPPSAGVPLEQLGAMARSGVGRGSAVGPARVTLRWAGLAMRVTSPDRHAIDWLVEFLAPHAEEDREGGADVELWLEPASPDWRPRAPVGPPDGVADGFVLDTRVVRLPFWELGYRRVAVDHDRGVRFEIRPGRVAVVAATDAALRIAAMRAMREMATAGWRRQGGRLVHAAALAVEGGVILIGGPKGSGKTTLLVHALGLAGARFVANDRVVVRVAGGEIEAHGIPTVVSHRPGTLPAPMRDAAARRGYAACLTLAEARASGGTHGPEVPSLSPAQLCELAGVSRVAGGPVRAVLLPMVDPSHDALELRGLSAREAADHVRALRFGPPGDPSSQLFAPPPPAAGPVRLPAPDPLAALQEGVPWAVVGLRTALDARDRGALGHFLAGL